MITTNKPGTAKVQSGTTRSKLKFTTVARAPVSFLKKGTKVNPVNVVLVSLLKNPTGALSGLRVVPSLPLDQ